jgi:hypothetical protein
VTLIELAILHVRDIEVANAQPPPKSVHTVRSPRGPDLFNDTAALHRVSRRLLTRSRRARCSSGAAASRPSVATPAWPPKQSRLLSVLRRTRSGSNHGSAARWLELEADGVLAAPRRVPPNTLPGYVGGSSSVLSRARDPHGSVRIRSRSTFRSLQRSTGGGDDRPGCGDHGP